MSSAEYNQLLKFLYFEGYADSYEEAEYILEEMDDEEFEELLESSGMTPENKKTWERLTREKGPNPFTAPEKTKSSRSARKIEPPSEPRPRKKRKLEYEVREEFEDLSEKKYDRDEELPSGRTPRQNMERQRGRHSANYLLRSRETKDRKDQAATSHFDRASTMDIVKSAQDKGEEPSKDPAWINTIAARRRPRASYEVPNERPGGLRAKATKAGGYRTLVRKEETEMFETVVEYLFVEGYADTIESATLMAENISEDWVDEILEARASERRGMGSPESALSYPGRTTQKQRGEAGGRHWQSGGQGGSTTERGKRKSEPESQAQRLRRLSTHPEKSGRYAAMQARKRGSEMGSPRD